MSGFTVFGGATFGGNNRSAAVPSAATNGLKVELELTTGTYTDVSTFLDAASGLDVRKGRADEFDDIQPGVANLRLYSDDGRFIPDNPLSPYWPAITEGLGLRLTWTQGGVASYRHIGRVTSVKTSILAPNVAGVELTSADVLHALGQRILRSDFAEQLLYRATDEQVAVDAYLLAETDGATTLANIDPAGPAAVVVQSQTSQGSVKLGSADGLLVEGAATFAPGDLDYGPVILATPRTTTMINVGFAMRTSAETPAVSATVATYYRATTNTIVVTGGGGSPVIVTRTASGPLVPAFYVKVTNRSGFTDLDIFDGSNVFLFNLTKNMNHNGWHRITFTNTGTTNIAVYHSGVFEQDVFKGNIGANLREVSHAVFGGEMNPSFRGKNTACFTGEVAAPFFTGSSSAAPSSYLTAFQTTTGDGRRADFTNYIKALAASVAVTGTTERNAARKTQSVKSTLTAFSELAGTLGANLYVNYSGGSGVLTWVHPSALRQATPVGTITLNADDLAESSGLPLLRSGETRPTRVTASWPGGSTVVVDTAAEAGVGASGARRVEESVDTTAADEAGARDVAAARIARSGKLRIPRLAIDLTSTPNATTLWGVMKDITPGARLRLANIPTALLGVSYHDFYIAGWTEHYDFERASMILDTIPADDPPTGVFDSSTYGRFAAGGTMNVTGGTAVGTTATGTIIVTTTAGNPTFTTTGADWPIDLNWNGERVTVTAAPAGSASPQTLTITARGVAPTIARVHGTAEQIDVWFAAAFTF